MELHDLGGYRIGNDYFSTFLDLFLFAFIVHQTLFSFFSSTTFMYNVQCGIERLYFIWD